MAEETKDEYIKKHIENIFFMRALYGHTKAYAESFPGEKKALKLENGELLSPLDLKTGVEWQLRRLKWDIIQHLVSVNAPSNVILELKEWMFSTGKQ